MYCSYERNVRMTKKNDSERKILFCLSLICRRDRRFLVVGPMQFILVEPDMKIAACGIVKFCDFMQVCCCYLKNNFDSFSFLSRMSK